MRDKKSFYWRRRRHMALTRRENTVLSATGSPWWLRTEEMQERKVNGKKKPPGLCALICWFDLLQTTRQIQWPAQQEPQLSKQWQWSRCLPRQLRQLVQMQKQGQPQWLLRDWLLPETKAGNNAVRNITAAHLNRGSDWLLCSFNTDGVGRDNFSLSKKCEKTSWNSSKPWQLVCSECTDSLQRNMSKPSPGPRGSRPSSLKRLSPSWKRRADASWANFEQTWEHSAHW